MSRPPFARIARWLLPAAILPLLAGCFGAAVVGVGAGALMITDRRVTETYVADEAIEIRACNRIGEKFGDKVHVNCTSFNRMLLLTGEVPDAASRSEVEKVASGAPNVKSITNELQVSGVSSLGSRSNDAYVTSKVKARFIDYNQFTVNHVKVITEAGTVYLLGLVTQREGNAAVEIARTTSGVLKVVRVFETISEEEARRLDRTDKNSQPAKAPVK